MGDYDEMEVETADNPPRLKSTIQRGTYREDAPRFGGASKEVPKATGPAKSVEGWVVFVTGIHEESRDEDLHEAFAEYGDIKNLYLNLDRQTGFVKGYAIIEYGEFEHAETAAKHMNGAELLGQQLRVDFAFSNGAINKRRR
ncbi:hypothetical protein BSKO_10435 [Bryopsis sp. KO-2023]|nr:hypothetical protein BSKO_10435 [Bryopsis sp. KO-2023]